MRLKSAVCAALLSLGVASYRPLQAVASVLNDTDLSTSQFDVTDKTQVPGSTLAAGHYTIRILDHLSDRSVLQIESDKGKLSSTFLGLPNSQMGHGQSGAIPYGDTRKAALRGFAFADGTVLEFVYPKAQAVTIARLNSTKVPAIDPPSEGLPADNKLSRNDMSLVTLWLLSPTFVGNESKPMAVLAQRYQAPAAPVQPVVAQTQPAPTIQPVRTTATVAPAPQPVLMAKVTRKPVLAHLPHTAGYLPLVWLFAGLSFFGALMLRLKKGLGASARA